MATPVRRTDSSIAETLLETPWDFDFFQAVRLIGWVFRGRRLLSGFNQPFDEIVRFQSHLSLAFPSSAIQSLAPDERQDHRLRMTVNFMGLTGPQGVLPTTYTEYLIARDFARDRAAAAFFDLFNHRLISLFYLAWEKHHFPVAFEREAREETGSRRFTQYLLDLIGMGTAHLHEHLGIDETVLLGYAGLIAQRPRSAAALASLLRDYFQVPVEIDQFSGKWCPLEDETLSYLDGEDVRNQLGCGAIIGDQVWNQQACFRICVGPLNWARYNEFLPTGKAWTALVELARYFVNRSWEFEVQLVLEAGEVPWCEISGETGSPRLGQSTWLKTEPFTENVQDLVLGAG